MGTKVVTAPTMEAPKKVGTPLEALRNSMARHTSKPIQFVGGPVWAEVSLNALRQNLEAIRDYVNPASEKRGTPRKVLCIVKGNGYGHGGPDVS